MNTVEALPRRKNESQIDGSHYDLSIFDDKICNVINRFLQKQKQTIRKCAAYYYPDYIKGFHFLFSDNFSPLKLKKKLNSFGWTPIIVDGYLTGYDYFQHLTRREIPINIHIRPDSQIDFALFPDTIHDIFGHCPMLMSKKYSLFLDEISAFISSIELGDNDREYLRLHKPTLETRIDAIHLIEEKERELKENPTAYYYHTSVALWTLEFGVIQNRGNIHAYGAALVASPLEMTTLSQKKYSIAKLTSSTASTNFNFSNLQNQLFSTSGFNEAKEIIQAFSK